MAISNDIDLEPDMAMLTISKPAKSQSVDITKLPLDGPNAPGASSKPLHYAKVRPPKDSFIKRKKPVQRTIEGLAANTQVEKEQNILDDCPSAQPETFCFSSSTTTTTQVKASELVIDRFPNLTNPSPSTGPDYSHRSILASHRHPLPHCQDKSAPKKCHTCLLHDFQISDARLKEAKIRLADAEIIVKSKTSKAEDKLQKKMLEWEGERNLMIQEREDSLKESVEKAVKEGVKERGRSGRRCMLRRRSIMR